MYRVVYYQNLKEMIDNISKKNKIDGVTLKNLFVEKHGGGSFINMNKALKSLRKYNLVNFEKVGVRIYYWKKK